MPKLAHRSREVLWLIEHEADGPRGGAAIEHIQGIESQEHAARLRIRHAALSAWRRPGDKHLVQPIAHTLLEWLRQGIVIRHEHRHRQGFAHRRQPHRQAEFDQVARRIAHDEIHRRAIDGHRGEVERQHTHGRISAKSAR
jgi:hypothetical protein